MLWKTSFLRVSFLQLNFWKSCKICWARIGDNPWPVLVDCFYSVKFFPYMGFFLLSFVIIIADDFVLLNKHYYITLILGIILYITLILGIILRSKFPIARWTVETGQCQGAQGQRNQKSEFEKKSSLSFQASVNQFNVSTSDGEHDANDNSQRRNDGSWHHNDCHSHRSSDNHTRACDNKSRKFNDPRTRAHWSSKICCR